MCIRREVFESVGGFDDGLGRVGRVPAGCEETELCIRARRRWPDRIFMYEPRAKIYHQVPATRGTWRYFRERCYMEGISKSHVARIAGSADGLAAERSYTSRTLPRGIARNLSNAVRCGEVSGLLRAGSIVAGLSFVAAGYAVGASSEAGRQLRCAY